MQRTGPGLPDPSELRSVATVLAGAADAVRGQCAAAASAVRDVRWSAPVVDELRHAFAQAQAASLTGSAGLDAGAAHLRGLASVVEELTAAAARLHRAAQTDLQQRLATSVAGPAADLARRQLEQLPGVDDPSWALLAGARPLALPDPVVVPVPPVLLSPPGRVEVDLDGARRAARQAQVCAAADREAADRARSRTALLDLALLDRVGLAGSRSAGWLGDLVGGRSPLLRAADTWSDGARSVLLLVDLLAAADAQAALLADPRLPLAMAVLAAVGEGPAALDHALAAVSPDDRAWLREVVPGLRPSGAWWLPGPLDWADLASGLWQVPADLAESAQAGVQQLRREIADLRATIRGLTGEAREQARRELIAVQSAGRLVREQSWRLERLARRLRVPRWLRSLSTRPVADVPVLRAVPRLGAIGAAVGLGLDLHSGTSLPLALAKVAAGLAAAAAVGAAATAVLVGAPVAVVVVGTLVAGAVAATVAAGAVARYGPAAWRQVVRLGAAVGSLGKRAASAGGRALGGLRRLGSGVRTLRPRAAH